MINNSSALAPRSKHTKGEVMSIDLGLLRGVPMRCPHAF
jgi:hypothetical protein